MRHRVGLAAERLGWEREAGESELDPAAARRPPPRPRHPRQRRGDAGAGARDVGPATGEDESALDPNVLPAVIAILAFTGGEREYADFLQRFRKRGTRRRSSATSTRWAPSASPRSSSRPSSGPSTGRCGARTRPSWSGRCSAASMSARGLAWEFVKEHWETDGPAVPGQRLPPAVRGRDGPREPRVGARRAGLLHRHEHLAGRQDARAVPRAAQRGGPLPGARIGRPLEPTWPARRAERPQEARP